MPLAVTAYGVKIASSPETVVESHIVCEVIADWNAHHTWKESRILLPLTAQEGAGGLDDLLVAFFCAADGGSIPASAVKDEAEIEAHLAGGRPALIYFSKARVDLASTQGLRARALSDFQASFPSSTVDSYADEKELRAKFSFQLDAIIGSHDHFKQAGAVSLGDTISTMVSAPKPTPPPVAPLSEYARLILSEACDDFEAYIGHMKIGDMLRIQANGKQLVEQGDKAVAAKWEAAFQELLQGGYIRDAGCNGQLFQISTKGFEFLKSMGKTPVGYIAELGGM